MKFGRFVYAGLTNRAYLEITLGRFSFSFYDWSLSVRDRHIPWKWSAVFALRCACCRRWTLGCGEHRLCGLCPQCKAALETDEDLSCDYEGA